MVGEAVVEITGNGASYAGLLAVIVTASRELVEGDLGFSGDITPLGPRRSAV